MKRNFTLALIAALFTIFSGLLFASDVVSKTYDFKDFSKVKVSSGMILTVTQSDTYRVEVNIDDKDLKYFRAEQNGDEVEFSLRNNFFSFFGHRHGRIEISIKMPSLTGLGMSGGSIAKITMDVPSKNFSGGLSGGSKIMGNLNCGNSKFNLSGGSRVKLAGKGNDLRISGSGGSSFELKDFSVNNVSASFSGGTHATVTMNGTLDTKQSGGSRIIYYGNAVLGNTDFSGGSGVSKGD